MKGEHPVGPARRPDQSAHWADQERMRSQNCSCMIRIKAKVKLTIDWWWGAINCLYSSTLGIFPVEAEWIYCYPTLLPVTPGDGGLEPIALNCMRKPAQAWEQRAHQKVRKDIKRGKFLKFTEADKQQMFGSTQWWSFMDDLHGRSCCSAPEKPNITQNPSWCRFDRPTLSVRREMSPPCGHEVVLHDLVTIPAETSFLKIRIYFHTAVS